MGRKVLNWIKYAGYAVFVWVNEKDANEERVGLNVGVRKLRRFVKFGKT